MLQTAEEIIKYIGDAKKQTPIKTSSSRITGEALGGSITPANTAPAPT